MQSRTDILSALLFSVIAIACGDERSPWSGFPLFPPDGGPELAPELQSSLRAAEIAFVTQLAAEQAAKTAGATAVPEASQTNADAGVKPPPRMAADTDGRSGNGSGPKSAEPRKRDAPDGGAEMSERAAAGAHSEGSKPPMRPSDPEPTAPMEAGVGGQVGSSAPSSQPDAGMMVPATAGTDAMTAAGAGAMTAAGAGGSGGAMTAAGAGGAAGTLAPGDYPSQPSEADAAIPDDAADGGI